MTEDLDELEIVIAELKKVADAILDSGAVSGAAKALAQRVKVACLQWDRSMDRSHQMTQYAAQEIADLRGALAAYEHGLNAHERLIVQRIADRLRHGKKTYGEWSPAKYEAKFYILNLTEELLDALVYMEMSRAEAADGTTKR